TSAYHHMIDEIHDSRRTECCLAPPKHAIDADLYIFCAHCWGRAGHVSASRGDGGSYIVNQCASNSVRRKPNANEIPTGRENVRNDVLLSQQHRYWPWQ